MKLRNQSCQLILGHYNITQIRASENFQVLGKNFQALEQKFQALGKKIQTLEQTEMGMDEKRS
ncbi:hypothetical protein JJE63_01715 [Alloprevotella tannerae]|uniref:hypothetical protein n=1 Tax=Alloprevotella tannerae TaxID=76122 RepID=UPI001EDBE4A1|nr:hypothetical protein [Alloprevotella tannerae]MCG2652051.1 hypothetical protein [Alloprevotella tannerae]